MSLPELASSFEVQAAAGALLHFIWQGGVIAALLWLVLALVPSARAALRYAAACGALGLLALCPPVTLAYLLTQAPPAAALAGPAELVPRLPVERARYLAPALLMAWALGSGLMTLRLLLGVAALRRLVASATVASEHWQWQLQQLARRLRLRQRVLLSISPYVDAPVVLGWLRPVILLPLSALSSLPPSYVQALLAHELGHVRRLDYLVNVLQTCVEALLFYHPAVHWVSRCMRIEREHCCDDIAVQLTGQPLRYARALAEMETLRVRLPEPALAANGGSLMFRIERILKRPASSQAEPRVLLTASCVLAGALGLTLAGIWACSSPGESSGAPPETVELAAEAAAPGIAVPWLPESLAPYRAALVEAAQRHDVDPALVAIVTLAESMGDPRAVSSMGARGLMQLMPDTAAKIAAERQLGGHSVERLFEPEYNLDLGAWFLSRQLAAFGGGASEERAVELAATAYNCGPHLARQILDGSAALPAETAKYRALVVGMWKERGQAESPTFAAWQQGLSSRAVSR
jgi:beta-lactamase regulating signal transducer with metallopeptidase domain